MRGCVSFQIKVQILAFCTDVCTGHKQIALLNPLCPWVYQLAVCNLQREIQFEISD